MRNTMDAVQQRYQTVTQLYLKGMPQYEIALTTNVTPRQIRADLVKIKQQWRTTILANIGEMQQRELSKLDSAEQEAYEQYEKSKLPIVRVHTKTRTIPGKDGQEPVAIVETYKTEEHRPADSSFLQIIVRISSQRCKLLGLNETGSSIPASPNPTSGTVIAMPGSTVNVNQIRKFNPEQLKAIQQLSKVISPDGNYKPPVEQIA